MSGLRVLRIGRRISLPIGRRFLIAAPLLAMLLAVGILTALMTGSTDAQMPTILDLRLPRVMVGVLAGALLAISGYLLQVVARNGLADPSILGLSDGATLAVMGAAVLFPAIATGPQSLIAFGGALGVGALVLTLGRRLLDGGGIILVGLAINIVLGAMVEVILVSGSALQFSRLMVWSRGTLATVDAADLRLVLVWASFLIPMVLVSARVLSPLMLGSDLARGVGLRAAPAKAGLILLAAACAAPVVATCGPVAFVGLMAAHVARACVGDRPTEVLVTAMLVGGLILLWADTLGRSLFAPMIVSAGIVVSVVGVIAFLIVAGLSRRGYTTI